MRGLEALYIGSALGIGNFLLLPGLFALYDFRLVLFFHFLSLVMLGVPLVVGEILWARWLRRSYTEAFQFLGKPYSWTPWVSVAALLLVTPLYMLDLIKLGLGFVAIVRRVPIRTLWTWDSMAIPVWALGAWVLLWGYAALPRKWVARGFFWTLIVAIICLASALLIQLPAYRYFALLDLPGSQRGFVVTKDMFLDVASFSLFTLSAGLGIHFLFTWWASPFRKVHDKASEYWKVPGRVHRIALKVLGADFILSLFVAAIVMPWLSLGRVHTKAGFSFETVFFEWMPEFFRASDSSLSSLVFLFVGLFLLGLLSLASLLEVFVHGLQRIIGLKRMRASALASVSIGVLCLVASVPFFGRPMKVLAYEFVLPLAALLWSFCVGRKLPKRDFVLLVGRSPSSDAFSLLWRAALRLWVPLFLFFYLVLRLVSRIGF